MEKYVCYACGKEYEVDEDKYYKNHPHEFFMYDLIDCEGTKINLCGECCKNFAIWLHEQMIKEKK